MLVKNYYRYWAKTEKIGGDDAVSYHLLPYHCLDVAAVGAIYLAEHPFFRDLFSQALGLEPGLFCRLSSFFLALHDLGKFTLSFQAQAPEVYRELRGRLPEALASERHDNLGLLLWKEKVSEALHCKGIFSASGSHARNSPWLVWAEAVTGHHGQPPRDRRKQGVGRLRLNRFVESEDEGVATLFAEEVGAFFLDEPVSAPGDLKERLGRASWWLAGLTVLCDWLGSNRHYFAMHQSAMPLEEYWNSIALPSAGNAIRESGVLPAKSAVHLPFGELFSELSQFPPTPLQELAGATTLGDGPQLFIIEDVTGAGKTEAALTLVNRLMAEGAASGLYMALPTMATADAMYSRVGNVYSRLFDSEDSPSLVLAHGSRMLNRDFRASFERPPAAVSRYAQGEESASAFCARWLADNKKKALLADCGVGTIDQALMAVLYARHQSLRLFGLTRKVLLVDEVHACDDYQLRLLETLIGAHAAAGGSTILLSATLPGNMRQALARAYRQGIGLDVPELTAQEYPLLTQVGPFEFLEQAVATRPSVQRQVKVRLVHSLEEAEDYLIAASEAGRCGCWIRNSVADAAATSRALDERMKENVDLFHAQFALVDRLKREADVLDRFGKRSVAGQRAGRLLVASQVVEQSLDLDFDVLVTDLAPIDLVIQRAGRLQRHVRDGEGNPTEGARDGREAPEIIVVAPPPVNEPDVDWLESLLPRTARVYPDHYRLWLTARRLQDAGAVRMPEDARSLVEAVYGAQVGPEPAGLTRSSREATGDALNKRGQALQNSIRIDDGYRRNSARDWWEDTLTPTRLGDPSVTLRLARWEGQVLKPWAPDAEDAGDAWRLSEVSVPLHWIGEGAAPADPGARAAVEFALESMPDKGRWCVVVPMEERGEGEWVGRTVGEPNTSCTLVYTDEGLTKE